ncbi:MAG TPA: GNAT family N-acetyltransferase [Jatrophihabitans sp.]|nr:GNAT family N-acetyltransferase [Jatrophihabitans sp.]
MRGYRGTLLLCALILLGWGADLALGGGVVHAVGWLLALLLVGGISGLGARARRGRSVSPAVTGLPDEAPSTDTCAVRRARPAELAELIDVELAADRLFPLAGYGPTPGPATVQELAAAAAVLVVGDPPVGYARMEVVDGQAHLEGLSVRPKYMRQGRGRALVSAGIDWARRNGYSQVTLCTFADVPWNAPFYRRLGFVELTELTPGLRALREHERRLKLDEMGRRIVMVRRVETLES